MHNPSQESAMTEVALALAMGFFSLMVLTLISMGVDGRAAAPNQTAVLAPAASPSEATGAREPRRDDRIVIFDGGRFLDRDLNPVDPRSVAATAGGGRLVLAVDPALPLEQAMAARARIPVDDLVVSTLDAAWLAALSRNREDRP